MKRFLILIVSVWFVWGTGIAQTPTPGTISVLVPKHLEIALVNEPNQFFTYNEFDPDGTDPTIETSSARVTIEANVNWRFSIVTANSATVLTNQLRPSATINANMFKYAALGLNGAVLTSGSNYQPLGPTCTTPISGSKSLMFKLNWKVDPKFSENYYAGDYIVGVNYLTVEQ